MGEPYPEDRLTMLICRGLDYPNRFGEWPFEMVDGQMDVSKPNLGYFEFVDWVVDLAATLGIRVALVPTWGRYIGGGESTLVSSLLS